MRNSKPINITIYSPCTLYNCKLIHICTNKNITETFFIVADVCIQFLIFMCNLQTSAAISSLFVYHFQTSILVCSAAAAALYIYFAWRTVINSTNTQSFLLICSSLQPTHAVHNILFIFHVARYTVNNTSKIVTHF